MFGPDVFPPTSISSEKAAAPGKLGPSTPLPSSLRHTPPLPTFPMGAARPFSGKPCGCQGQSALKSKVWPGVGASFSCPQGPSKHTLQVKLLRFSRKLFQSESPSFLSNRCLARQDPRRNPGAFFIYPQHGWPNHDPAGHEPEQKGPEQAWDKGQGASHEPRAPWPDEQSKTCLQGQIIQRLLLLKPGL